MELPGWNDEAPFIARLRRPSLLAMAAQGVIPNELLTAAQGLFSEGYDAKMPLDQLGKLLISVARAALVEPEYDQLAESGVSLTDVQLAAIYSFTQSGVRALEPFRNRTGADISAGNEPEICAEAEPTA